MRSLTNSQKGLVAVFALASAIGLAAGCGGSSNGTTSPTPTQSATPCTAISPTLTALQANVFTPTCAVGSSCHSGNNPAGPGLDLSSPATVLSTASNKTAVETFNGSSATLLVPGSKETSYLYNKVMGTTGITPVRMPQTGQALNACQTSALGIWIDAGIPNN